MSKGDQLFFRVQDPCRGTLKVGTEI